MWEGRGEHANYEYIRFDSIRWNIRIKKQILILIQIQTSVKQTERKADRKMGRNVVGQKDDQKNEEGEE